MISQVNNWAEIWIFKLTDEQIPNLKSWKAEIFIEAAFWVES